MSPMSVMNLSVYPISSKVDRTSSFTQGILFLYLLVVIIPRISGRFTIGYRLSKSSLETVMMNEEQLISV